MVIVFEDDVYIGVFWCILEVRDIFWELVVSEVWFYVVEGIWINVDIFVFEEVWI